jgi:uncharacterized repeat protein (TIGR01451 family)
MKNHLHWIRWMSLLVISALLLGEAAGAVSPSYALTGDPGDPKPEELRNTDPSQARSEEILVRLANSAFDPLQGIPAGLTALPEGLAYTPEQATAAGMYIVQFSGPVLPEWKRAIAELGGMLGDYLPDYAFIAFLDPVAFERAQALSFVRWIGPYEPAYKLAPAALLGIDAAEARSYRITLAPWADASAIGAVLNGFDARARSFGVDLERPSGFIAVLAGDQLVQAARLPGVTWIEPLSLQRSFNDVGGGTIMGGSTAWSNGYTGSGMVVAVTDTGLDTGNPSGIHADFSGRVAQISSWPVQYANYGGGCETANNGADDGAADTESGHGTHVTGSVAGNGANSSGQFKGLAYEATITFQAVEQYTQWTVPNPFSCPNGYYLTGIPDDVRQLLTEVYGWGARVQNNSWGGGDYGAYDTQAQYFDDFVFNHQDMAVVVAAGNDGIDANANGYVDENSISSPGTAKNLITVGASDNERNSGGISEYTWYQLWGSDYPTNPTRDDYTSDTRQELAAFSSRGPMSDGRIKPDVVAPGTNILSTRSSLASESGWGSYNTYYMYMGGTSMASPLTAGSAALVRDYYITTEGLSTPSAALIKATLINTAVDISGYGNSSQEAGQPIPNMHEGWGLVNVAGATTPGRAFIDEAAGLNTGNTHTYSYSVGAGQPFKVTLVWSDYPGSPSGGAMLVNNLNLRLTAPNGTTTYWGNVFSGGWSQTGGSADTVNNVENVYIQSPTAGTWTIEVIGQNIPQGPQLYALVVDGDISPREELTVISINPDQAYNNGLLSGAQIDGTGFDSAATVALMRGVQTIPGVNVSVDTDNDVITADFNLAGAAPGLWDVRVTNPEESATLEDGLLVLDATLPDLVVTKTASQSQVDPGSLLTYTIEVANDGLVPATGVTFTDTLPVGVIFESLNPACSGGVDPLPGGFACTLQPSTLPAAGSVDYTLVVSVPINLNGLLVNTVVVGSVEQDAYPADNTDSVSVRSGSFAILLPMVLKNWPPVPGAPTLNAIDNSDNDGNYTLTWTPGSGPAPSSYDIEENGSVIAAGYVGTSYNISGKSDGTYAYRVRAKNAYGSSAWSNTQSTTVGVPVNPIQNGDFENGQDGSWTEYSSNGFDLVLPASDLIVPTHSGNWAVWLGGWTSELSTLTQQVQVPVSWNTLSFWYYIASAETSCGNDIGRVLVNGTQVYSFNLCSSGSTSGWVEGNVSLAAYAGQSVQLQFYVQLNGMLNSNLFLDDVSFE